MGWVKTICLLVGHFFMLVDTRVAFRNQNGELDFENKGVAPDINVDLDSKLWRMGRDVQLEKAVEITMGAVKRNPQKKTGNGPFPNYAKP